MIHRVSILFAVACAALFGQIRRSTDEPRFSDYPATVVPRNASVPPKLQTPGQRRFRTVIRDWVEKGTNFAGYFTVAEWGCGTGCEQIAIINGITGDVFDGPFGKLPKGFMCLGGNVEEDRTGIFYRANSSLLVVRGCPNYQACGSYYYYHWTGNALRLLRHTPMKPVFGCGP